MDKKSDNTKKFLFFGNEDYKDSPKDNIYPSLNDIAIDQAIYVEPNFYFASKREKIMYVYEQLQNNNDKLNEFSITASILPFESNFYFLEKAHLGDQQYIVTFGVDLDQNQQKYSVVKIYEPQTILDYIQQQLQQQNNTLKMTDVPFLKKIQIGKTGQPVDNCGSFAISEDMTNMAFGLLEGQILIYKSKSNHNLLTGDPKSETLQADAKSIRCVYFSRTDGQLNLFYTTDDSVYVRLDMHKSKKLSNQGGNMYDITPSGKLIGCASKDNVKILMHDPQRRDPSVWTYVADKQKIKSFKNNYVILLCVKNNSSTEQSFIIYDLVNEYIAYYKDFKNVQLIIPTYVPNRQDMIHLITLTQKGEKKIIKLTEKENAFKMENFFKKSHFDIAYKFAKNQDPDPALLAEISKLNADNLYSKGEYKESIYHYTQTIGFIEPSYVIRQFLDVQHIEYLIEYLEQIHKQKLADKHHTALLLNCYVKQKKIQKLQEFLKESKFESDLFDIETAIKVCRELKKYDLALQLAEQKKQHEYYLQILTEDRQEHDQAIDYIRQKIPVEDKVRFILEFGQDLMKNSPQKSLELIQKIVHLSIIAYNMTKRVSTSANMRPPTKEEKEVYLYLNISEKEQNILKTITFRKPDEFLHLFVVKSDNLKNYLEFLTTNFNEFPNEKAIYHRLFEYYLEQYHSHSKKIENSENRQQQDLQVIGLQMKITDILQDLQNSENDKKFDRNHLLVLFKMYNFSPGIILLCEKMNLREELINFYITNNKTKEIIDLCSKYGSTETNLWVQALKHFTKADATEDQKKYLPEILKQISNLPSLSPLLILTILAKNKNIEFKSVKEFFIEKLEQDRKEIDKDKNGVDINLKQANDYRNEYKKLKTEARVFQPTNCEECNYKLNLPTLNFMCGHSFHYDCIQSHILNQDFTDNQCATCYEDFNRILETKQAHDQQATISKGFFDKIDIQDNKFDVITEFLGKGLFQMD